MHAQTLLGMRDSLLSVKKERTKLNKVARMLDRDLRILICADSNQAVDNMLKILHNTKDFIAQGYTIARLGSVGQMEDPELAHYNLDEQVKSHNLYTMYEKLWLAVLDRNLSHKELQQVANDYVESLKKIQYRLRNEAEQTTALESIRVKLAELADNCIESLIGRVPELVGLFVNSKARTEERKCNLKALKDLLRNELKPLAKYVLLIRAQVRGSIHSLLPPASPIATALKTVNALCRRLCLAPTRLLASSATFARPLACHFPLLSWTRRVSQRKPAPSSP